MLKVRLNDKVVGSTKLNKTESNIGLLCALLIVMGIKINILRCTVSKNNNNKKKIVRCRCAMQLMHFDSRDQSIQNSCAYFRSTVPVTGEEGTATEVHVSP